MFNCREILNDGEDGMKKPEKWQKYKSENELSLSKKCKSLYQHSSSGIKDIKKIFYRDFVTIMKNEENLHKLSNERIWRMKLIENWAIKREKFAYKNIYQVEVILTSKGINFRRILFFYSNTDRPDPETNLSSATNGQVKVE